MFYGSNVFSIWGRSENAPLALESFFGNITVQRNLLLLRLVEIDVGEVNVSEGSVKEKAWEIEKVLDAARCQTGELPDCNTRVIFTFVLENRESPLCLQLNPTSTHTWERSVSECVKLIADTQALEIASVDQGGFRGWMIRNVQKIGLLEQVFLAVRSSVCAGR